MAGLKPSTYGALLAAYTSISAFFTYVRFAEWYDTARQLNYGIPFYFGYTEGAIRGGLSAVAVSVLILIVFRRGLAVANPHPSKSAVMILAGYFLTVGLNLVSQPQAYDPGLFADLMLVGLVAGVSTFLYGESLRVEKELTILDKDRQLKWIELQHKQTSDMITTMIWMILFAIAGMGYNSGVTFWQALETRYGQSDPLVWRTFTVSVLRFSFVAVGFAVFTLAPLFFKLGVLVDKLKKNAGCLMSWDNRKKNAGS